MIFVQLADGAEFLFLGDVAWKYRNVEKVRERPRFLTLFLLHEDRTAVLHELAALHQLQAGEPDLHMIAGHDGEAIGTLVHQGALIQGFE